MDADFQKLLSQRVDDAKPPPVFPAGHYFGVIRSQEYGKSAKKQTPFCRYMLQLTGPSDDVSADMLVDDEGAPLDVTKRQFRADFYLTQDSLFRLANFLKSINISTEGRGFDETIPEAIGAQIIAELSVETTESGNPINNVKDVAGIEES